MSNFTDYTSIEDTLSITEVSFEEIRIIPTTSAIMSMMEPDDIDTLAPTTLMDEKEITDYDFYDSKKTTEQRFFVIGMIYADLLAKLKGRLSRDVILEELTTLQLGLDALDASDAIYSYLFELENIISDDEYSEYSKAASSKVLSMLYPFIEDLAASLSLGAINNLRAGQWLVDMRIVATTKNQGFAQQSEISQRFADAYEKAEVKNLFKEISRITAKSPLSNDDFSDLLNLLQQLKQEFLNK